jgi:AcrR family transcriptional regulator
MPRDVTIIQELDGPELEPPELDPPEREPARRRSTKGEQTRRVIAEAALRLFREHGYEATTMRAIATEAGVATGNAYYYFGSCEKTYRLIDSTAPLAERLIRLARLPVLRSMTRQLLAVFDEVLR